MKDHVLFLQIITKNVTPMRVVFHSLGSLRENCPFSEGITNLWLQLLMVRIMARKFGICFRFFATHLGIFCKIPIIYGKDFCSMNIESRQFYLHNNFLKNISRGQCRYGKTLVVGNVVHFIERSLSFHHLFKMCIFQTKWWKLIRIK